MRKFAVVCLSVLLVMSLILGSILIFSRPPSGQDDLRLRYEPADDRVESAGNPTLQIEEEGEPADGSAAEDGGNILWQTDNEPFPAEQDISADEADTVPVPAASPNAVKGVAVAAATGQVPASQEFRGVWVPSVYNLDFPTKAGLPVDTLKQDIISVLDNALDIGFNAVILQVRPTGDALYKSELFPWSDYLTGTQGKAPADGFDPLAFWVDEAHKRGLELHAWINPFRITKGSAKNPLQDVNKLAASNPARKNPTWTVKYTDGSLYYNPGIPEVRQLIVNGVSEVVRGYDVDGIHFDDYFYPGTDFPDDAAYKAYGKGFSNKNEWRRDNVNQLIKSTYTAVKQLRADCAFGVSPVGIWANKSSSAYGSDTKGQESYYEHFADSRKWVKSGWVDYICPQIYWHIGFDIADYQKLVAWWSEVVTGTPVELYVGQAAYRSGSGTKSSDPWYGANEIVRQLDLNATVPAVAGSVHYRYGSFVADPLLYAAVKNIYNPEGGVLSENEIVMPASNMGTLAVGRPSANTSTTGKNYYILGTSDPAQPLTMNGKPVEGRGEGGSFGVYVELKSGANVFTFTQGSTKVTRTITKKGASSAAPSKMSKAEITASSVYPYGSDEYRKPGESVTLTCTAPVGAKVTVTLGGKTYDMKPARKTAPSGAYYATTYTYTYTLPEQKTLGKTINLGKPTYRMSLGGKTSTRTARAIQCVTEGASYFAQVTSETAFVYAKASTSGGPTAELSKGQIDYVTAVTSNGAWVRLGMGAWIQGASVKRGTGDKALNNQIKSASYSRGSKWDILTLSGTSPTSTRVSCDSKALTLTVYSASSAPAVTLPADSPFSAVTAQAANGKAVYTLTLAPGQRIDGYYVSASGNKLLLNIKRTLTAQTGDTPLVGFTVLIDPGHGGSDSGALGPFGKTLPEKTINLYTAVKLRRELQKLGATVFMTRSSDIEVSLAKRVELNRSLRPDLFISVHGNSLDDDVNAAAVQGVSTWYREGLSGTFAKSLYNFVWNDLGRPSRGFHQANLYVARPTWTPSVIIETGFLCNPIEAEWMAENGSQSELANAIARGIVNYFQK